MVCNISFKSTPYAAPRRLPNVKNPEPKTAQKSDASKKQENKGGKRQKLLSLCRYIFHS